jgi:putative aldouronate transport system permease protein
MKRRIMSIALTKHPGIIRKARVGWLQQQRKHWLLYLMVIPGVAWLVMFRYIPFAGSVIAFQDYSIFRGVWGSDWVGLDHFERLFQYDYFWQLLRNTMLLAFYELAFGFPVPIILALAINEVRNSTVKRGVQSLLYLPHFLSWVIIAGLFTRIFGYSGAVNAVRGALGYEPVIFVQQQWFFRPMVILATIWRDSGWGTIIYLAAIAGISPSLYESAMVDGANRLQRIIHITIPSILPTTIVLLLLRVGRFMNLGFDRVWNFLTPLTYSVGDIFDTYVFRVGIGGAEYSFTTAVGLFQSVVAFVMIVGVNNLTKKTSGGLW